MGAGDALGGGNRDCVAHVVTKGVALAEADRLSDAPADADAKANADGDSDALCVSDGGTLTEAQDEAAGVNDGLRVCEPLVLTDGVGGSVTERALEVDADGLVLAGVDRVAHGDSVLPCVALAYGVCIADALAVLGIDAHEDGDAVERADDEASRLALSVCEPLALAHNVAVGLTDEGTLSDARAEAVRGESDDDGDEGGGVEAATLIVGDIVADAVGDGDDATEAEGVPTCDADTLTLSDGVDVVDPVNATD